MSEVFFKELGIPEPNIYLNIGSGSHAEQTAKVIVAFEKVVLAEKPDLVIVVGDVNPTAACALVAAKLHIKLAHVEAGLRSFDRTMPEEINRLVTDALSDYLFVTEESGMKNLHKEGVAKEKVFFVGNTMIDTLLATMPKINKSKILSELALKKHDYCVITLHRPSNVDSRESLLEIIDILKQISQQTAIVYPVHPRTRAMLEKHKLLNQVAALPNLQMISPLGYVHFMKLVKDSRFVLTDSGGIQEESTVLGVPCLTMRENTERPATIKVGTNKLVGRNGKKILSAVQAVLKSTKKAGVPPFWDGKTAGRIVKELSKAL
jgi:UDP-N-acetylglucosamine 2-epimerase (non-hydrolysing)